MGPPKTLNLPIRRFFFQGLCGICSALALAGSAAAFPTRPIRVVMGFPAGGPLDPHARLLTDRLQTQLGQVIIVDDKAGAGGTVEAQEVMRAAPDGHPLMLANTGAMLIHPALYSKLPYNTLRDFGPVARTAMQPLALQAGLARHSHRDGKRHQEL